MYPFLTIRKIILFWLIGLSLALGGCGSTQPKPGTPDQTAGDISSDSATRYEQLANQATDEQQKAVYQYLAAQAWLKEGFEDKAFFLFTNLNSTLLSTEQRFYRSMTLADFYSARGKPLMALNYLEDSQIQQDLYQLDDRLKSQWAAATAKLSALLGDYQRAVAVYDFALSYASTENPGYKASEHKEKLSSLRADLWQSLTLIDQLPEDPFLSSETKGWVALAEINNQSTGTISDQYLAYLLWQDQYFGHPAQKSPPASFSVLAEIASGKRPRVAILLPLTGPLASAGDAILDGYMTARAAEYNPLATTPADPLAPEQVKIYDTESETIYSIVRELEAEQYDLVIGPLDKGRVADYINLMPDIPTLALNNLPEDFSSREKPVLGLSLNVEDEAVQAGIKALQQGHQSALVLAPNSAWGDRAGFAFSGFWEAEGGEIIDFKSYGDSTTHAGLLEKTLQVDQSNQRKTELQKLLGKVIEFTPRRRQDIDALFLAASPAQARELKPMLAFFFAEDIPVYSTSSVYSGLADSKADRDLDGIKFSTLPWIMEPDNQLRKTIARHTAPTPTGLKMQAIGVDSYYLSQRLKQFLDAPDTLYRGVIGKLGRNPANNNLDRKQVWAEFKRGLARTSSR